MNRLAVGVLIVLLALAACTPSLSPVSAPNAQSTSVALAGTLAAQTVAALPTLTPPPTNTPLPTLPPTNTAMATNTVAASSTTAAGASTITATLAANTASAATITITGTLASPTVTITGTIPSPTKTVPPSITPTDEMIPRFYGTQPPRIDYGRIRLVNQAKAQVYVSFQCDTPDGYYVVVEYPVSGTFTVSVPAGRCAYVAWVGGREFAGEFGLGRFEELTMTFKKQSVTFK